MSTHIEYSVTHTSTVTEDQIDHLGHMNVRWYAVNAVAASRSVIGSADRSVAIPLRSAYTRHHREQLVHSALEVRSARLPSEDSLRLYHELRNQETDVLAAAFIHDLGPEPQTPVMELPSISEPPEQGRARSLNPAADLAARAPSLDDALSSGLALRRPREVGTEDTVDGGMTAAPQLASWLVWGGEPSEGRDFGMIHTSPAGTPMGYATMETHVAVGHLPVLGTRIQSFSAATDIGAKTLRNTSWAFDLSTGELLVVIDQLNLAFDLTTRRSMEIPDDYRALVAGRIRGDLRPA